ncbi:unnamed protein product [Merluccius merluccius]
MCTTFGGSAVLDQWPSEGSLQPGISCRRKGQSSVPGNKAIVGSDSVPKVKAQRERVGEDDPGSGVRYTNLSRCERRFAKDKMERGSSGIDPGGGEQGNRAADPVPAFPGKTAQRPGYAAVVGWSQVHPGSSGASCLAGEAQKMQRFMEEEDIEHFVTAFEGIATVSQLPTAEFLF